MIERYTKDEIVNAIKYAGKFNSRLESSLVRYIQENNLDAAYNEWELASKAYSKSLEDYANYHRKMVDKYGPIALVKLSEEERKEMLLIADKSAECERIEKIAYDRLKRVQDSI